MAGDVTDDMPAVCWAGAPGARLADPLDVLVRVALLGEKFSWRGVAGDKDRARARVEAR